MLFDLSPHGFEGSNPLSPGLGTEKVFFFSQCCCQRGSNWSKGNSLRRGDDKALRFCGPEIKAKAGERKRDQGELAGVTAFPSFFQNRSRISRPIG